MSNFDKLKQGILEANWPLVAEAYRNITGDDSVQVLNNTLSPAPAQPLNKKIAEVLRVMADSFDKNYPATDKKKELNPIYERPKFNAVIEDDDSVPQDNPGLLANVKPVTAKNNFAFENYPCPQCGQNQTVSKDLIESAKQIESAYALLCDDCKLQRVRMRHTNA